MTERQKQHGELYKDRGARDLRRSGKSLDVIINTPWVEPDDEDRLQTLEESLKQSACSADAVIIAGVVGKTSQLTENGKFVFSDYDVQVEEVLKADERRPLRQGDTVVVIRPGGAVRLNGNVFRVTDRSYLPLEKGGRYLLFLQQVAPTGAYRPIRGENSFELSPDKVKRVTAKGLPYEFTYEREPASLVALVRVSASACQGGAK